MGAAESNAGSSKYIKKSMRKALKKMAYMSQIANLVYLMPSPEQFATQVIGEVTAMAGKIRDFSTRISALLDDYTHFPSDYLAGATDNLLGTLNGYAERANGATQGMVDALHQAADDIDFLTTSSIGLITDEMVETNTATRYLGNQIDSVHESLAKVSVKANDVLGGVDKVNSNIRDRLQSVISEISDRMNRINEKLNGSFGDFLSVGGGEPDVKKTNPLMETGDMDSQVGNLVSELSGTIDSIVSNFDIGKVTTGLIGMATEIGLAAAGLDRLPELNMDQVLAFGRAKTFTNHIINVGRTKEFKESDEYRKIVEEAEDDKKKIREALRKKRRESVGKIRKGVNDITPEERIAKRSAAKDIRKRRLQAKGAKIAQKMKERLFYELERFKTDIMTFGNNLKAEWDTMYMQYGQAVKEIKEFFTGDTDKSEGSKFIDRCCDAIENDCDSIKETAQNLIVIITMDVSQLPTPSSIGQCFDNPAYKVQRWFECVKNILNEIKAIINYGVDIIRQVNAIVQIMLNGISGAAGIKERILEILGIKWIMDFIDKIMDIFSSKCKGGKELLENTLSPVFYNETDGYEDEMDRLYGRIENGDESGGEVTPPSEKDVEELEERGEDIIAYKSPILNEDGTDMKGWIFYHPDIDSMYEGHKLKQKFSRYLMKRAAKTGHKEKGGKNMLKAKNVFKLDIGMNIDGKYEERPKAYDAFYWYTKWTTEPTDDSIDIDNEGKDVVSPVMTTESGTLVELEDGRRVFVNEFGIRHGDYVIVEGQKYRVR